MRIIIAGAGDVGTYLIEKLLEERHALAVIDMNEAGLEKIASRYDVATVRGSCLSYEKLLEVGVNGADLYVGVTLSEELNLLSAIFAKRMGVKRVIARVRHSKLMRHNDVFNFPGLGIDELISPDALAAEEIDMLLEQHTFSDLIKFERGRYYLVGIPVKQGDGLEGKQLADITQDVGDGSIVPIAGLRNDATQLVREYGVCREGDHCFFIVQRESVVHLAQLVNHSSKPIRRAMILGGSRAGIETARLLLRRKYQVSIVERTRAFSEELASFLEGALVIHGDAREPGFLKEHDIDEVDALVAATGDPELNIITCIIAKKHNVTHTVTLVKDYHYLRLPDEFGADMLINKKMIAADFIVRHVKKGNVLSVANIPGLDMEALEFVVKSDSGILNRHLYDLELYKNGLLVVGGVLRDGKPRSLTEDVVLEVGDRVIAAFHHSCRDEFQELL